MSWSQSDIDTLRARIAEGLTARQIADKIGRTRNSVIGKAQRLGLSIGTQADNGPTTQRTRRKRRKGAAGLRSSSVTACGAVVTDPVPAPVVSLGPVADPAFCPAPLIDLRANQCKYPLWGEGDTVRNCCGARRDLIEPYCAAHMALTHVPIIRRTEKSRRNPEIVRYASAGRWI